MSATTILALDTVAAACSVALWRDDAVAARRFRAMVRGHAEALIPMVLEVMADAAAGFSVLDRVAVSVGPGSFTGLRIGLAAARGIGAAASVPVVGVSSFLVAAAAVPAALRRNCRLLALLDSKRDELFAQLFTADLTPVGAPQVIAPADLAATLPEGPLVVAGDGVALARAALTASGRQVAFAREDGPSDAAIVARLAATWPADSLLPALPVYLRPADAKLPARRP